MKQMSNVFTHRGISTFESLHMDEDLMDRIIEDMVQNAGILSPIKHWHLVEANDYKDTDSVDSSIRDSYDDKFKKQYENAAAMLDAWIGCVGKQELSEPSRLQKEYLDEIDTLGLCNHLNDNDIAYVDRDYTTISDVNIINAALEMTPGDTKYVLEVGGGYGRVSEAIMNVLSGIRYVMLDAVPGTLLYSYEYLVKMLPNKNIGYYYNGDAFDLEKYDLYIMPAWHFHN